MVRAGLVPALVSAPALLRLQLGVCVSQVVRHDFPARWPGLPEQLALHLHGPAPAAWPGALHALYKLAQHYAYKKTAERGPLSAAIGPLLPRLQALLAGLLEDRAAETLGVQSRS